TLHPRRPASSENGGVEPLPCRSPFQSVHRREQTRASFGQSRFSKAFNQPLSVCLPAPSDPPRYCKCVIDLKQASRRLTRLSVTSEMSESGRKTTVSYRKGGVLTKGFLPCDDCLVKATKLNKGISHSSERIE